MSRMLPPAGTEVAEFGLEATDPHLRPRKPLDDAFPCMYHRGNYLSVYLAKGKSPVLAHNWVLMTAKDGYRVSNRRKCPTANGPQITVLLCIEPFGA